MLIKAHLLSFFYIQVISRKLMIYKLDLFRVTIQFVPLLHMI